MVLHHIAQCTGLLVEGSAALDAQRLGCGDLHVVDVVSVPDGFEDAVGEAKDQDVLDRFLTQIVVDAEDLALVKDGIDALVQIARRSQVMSKGLFDDHADEAALGVGHSMRADVFYDASEKLRRGGQIKEAIATDTFSFVDAVQLDLQSCIIRWIIELEWKITDTGDEIRKFGVAGIDAAEFDDALAHVGGELLAQRAARHSDD